MYDELPEFVEAGISPYDALSSATRVAADFLGESAEFGRIAAGLRSDLVVLERNPLDDIAAVRTPLGVMTRGRWLGSRSR